MQVQTYILACASISDQARKQLNRAGFVVRDDVPGIEERLEIVVLYLTGPDDQVMSVWNVPRELQIASHDVFLDYTYDNSIGGYALTTWDERDMGNGEPLPVSDDLGELPDHPF